MPGPAEKGLQGDVYKLTEMPPETWTVSVQFEDKNEAEEFAQKAKLFTYHEVQILSPVS
jgi:hypothetical protein